MRACGIDVYVVPSADFHQSEYVGEYFKAREFISGFTGSAGVALITLDEARLWTDGRYFIQAEAQLRDTGYKLMKMGETGVPGLDEYLESVLKPGDVVAFDGRTISVDEGNRYYDIAKKTGAKIGYEIDLIGEIWTERPEMASEPAFELGLEYTGESTASKLERIRREMKRIGAEYHAVTSLDDICWILNIRGNDITYFPLVLAYSVISMESMELYIDEKKLDEKIRARLAADGIRLHPYNDIYEEIKKLPEGVAILIDPERFNYALYNSIPKGIKKIEGMNPSVLMKAAKNPIEIENIRKAQIKDSIAHIKFMRWLKTNIDTETITELSAIDKLEEFRKEQGNYIGPSFDPISAYGEHAAIIHYAPTIESNARLQEGNFLLTDTGAGYYEGSTDITRTYALGDVPKEFKKDFTLVATSNLTLANAKFTQDSTGADLDAIARKVLLEHGLNYNHGTGHGVGYLLNIHEDPVRFSPKGSRPLFENLVITDEPGVYFEGSHGIRLENELLCHNGHFEILTFIPFDLDAIDAEMMKESEKQMLNDYHKKVLDTMSPYLNAEEVEWLKFYTREI